MFLYVLLAACFVNTLAIDYLDNETVIIRRSPTDDEGALFGYSAVLHSVDASGGIDNMRLMVGAPLQHQPSNNGTIQPTGAVYTCLLTDDDDGKCSLLNHTSFFTFNDADFEFNNNTNQLLGISLYSTGNSFVIVMLPGVIFLVTQDTNPAKELLTVCAPRMQADLTDNQRGDIDFEVNEILNNANTTIDTTSPFENMPGRCFIGEQNLNTFTQQNYCYDIAGLEQCNIGATSLTGAVVESGISTFVTGLPTAFSDSDGLFLLTNTNGSTIIEQQRSRTGAAVSTRINSLCSEANESSSYGYDGYAVAVGHITSNTELDIITAQPRYAVAYITSALGNKPRIIGLVRVASNFYNPDGCGRYDYTSYVYGNTPSEYFGWSLVALDLTGDGYDEVLVSAPLYSYSNPNLNCLDCGRVYVYRNNATRNLHHEKDLLGTIPFGRFGYAMTSVGDINYDGCDDFVVSAPLSLDESESGTIYLYLGAGPTELVSSEYTQAIVGKELNGLASVVSFGSSLSSGNDLDNNGYNDLVIGAGFNETVAVLRTRPIFQAYTDMSSSSTSIGFANPDCEVNDESGRICFNVTIVIRDERKSITADYELMYTLTVDAEVNPPLLFVSTSLEETTLTGSVTLGPSKTFDTITHTIYTEPQENVVSRNALITLDVVVNDNGSAAVPRSLMPTLLLNSTSVTSLTIFLNGSTGCFASSSCQNDLELSERRIVSISAIPQTNSSIILVDVTNTVTVSVDFNSSVNDISCVQAYVSHPAELQLLGVIEPQGVECTDGLCFINNVAGNITMTFEFRVQLYPSDDSVVVQFNASSGCSEINGTDNILMVMIPVIRVTDLNLLRITVNPDQDSFEPLPNAMVDLSSDILGPEFNVTVEVRNSGPSHSPFSTLIIYWPLVDPLQPSQFFLYPLRINSDPSIRCSMEHINPNDIAINARRRRQSSSNTEISNEIWDCADEQDECSQIHCNVTNLNRAQNARITITSKADLRTFTRRGRNTQWELMVFAMVTSNDTQGANRQLDNATGTILIFPTIQEIPVDEEDDEIEIWMIIVAIIVAILIIIKIGLLLYCCGFWRRKKQTDEEANEETQKWVSASGTTTPADLSRENSMRARTLTDDYRNNNDDDTNTVGETKVTFEDNAKMDEEEKKSISGNDIDEKSSPTEVEKDAPPESNGEGALPEKDESSAPPDTNKDNSVAESSAAREGNGNSTTVELACQETDL